MWHEKNMEKMGVISFHRVTDGRASRSLRRWNATFS
jgi:hypothetical protein